MPVVVLWGARERSPTLNRFAHRMHSRFLEQRTISQAGFARPCVRPCATARNNVVSCLAARRIRLSLSLPVFDNRIVCIANDGTNCRRRRASRLPRRADELQPAHPSHLRRKTRSSTGQFHPVSVFVRCAHRGEDTRNRRIARIGRFAREICTSESIAFVDDAITRRIARRAVTILINLAPGKLQQQQGV